MDLDLITGWLENLDELGERAEGFFISHPAATGAVVALLLAIVGITQIRHRSRLRNPDRLLIRTINVWLVAFSLTRPRPLLNLVPGKVWYVAPKPRRGAHAQTSAESEYGKGQDILLEAMAWDLLHTWHHIAGVDPKRENSEEMAPICRALGVKQFYLDFLPDAPRVDPINIVPNRRMAAIIAKVLWPGHGPDSHWDGRARPFFVELCDYSGYANIVRPFDLASDPELLKEAARSHEGVRRTYAALNEKERGYVLSTLLRELEDLADPEVRRVFEAVPGRDPQPELSDRLQRIAIWIIDEPEHAQALGRLMHALIEFVFSSAMTAGAKTKGVRRGLGTSIFVDEGPHFAAAERLQYYLSLGRGYRTNAFIVSQDASQYEARLGAAEARSLMSRGQIAAYGRTDDEMTCKRISYVSGRSRVYYDPPRREPSMMDTVSGNKSSGPPQRQSWLRTKVLEHHPMELDGERHEWLVRDRSGMEKVRMKPWYRFRHKVYRAAMRKVRRREMCRRILGWPGRAIVGLWKRQPEKGAMAPREPELSPEPREPIQGLGEDGSLQDAGYQPSQGRAAVHHQTLLQELAGNSEIACGECGAVNLEGVERCYECGEPL